MTITPRYIEAKVIQGNGKNSKHFSVQTVATFLRDRNKCVRTYCQLMFDLIISDCWPDKSRLNSGGGSDKKVNIGNTFLNKNLFS